MAGCCCRVLLPHLSPVVIDGIDCSRRNGSDRRASTARGSRCRRCGRVSTRVHSRYRRQLADLPVAGRPVAVWLTVRRFFCDHVDCSAVHVRRAGAGVDRAARAPQRRPASSAGGGRVGPGRAGRISTGRHVGHGGEPVDATAADPGVAGSAGRAGEGVGIDEFARAAGTTTARCWSIWPTESAGGCVPRTGRRRLRRLATRHPAWRWSGMPPTPGGSGTALLSPAR